MGTRGTRNFTNPPFASKPRAKVSETGKQKDANPEPIIAPEKWPEPTKEQRVIFKGIIAKAIVKDSQYSSQLDFCLSLGVCTQSIAQIVKNGIGLEKAKKMLGALGLGDEFLPPYLLKKAAKASAKAAKKLKGQEGIAKSDCYSLAEALILLLNSEKEVISDSLKKSRGIDPEISGRVLDKTLENICEFTFLLTGQRPDPKKGKEV